jgi:hypothetical protein
LAQRRRGESAIADPSNITWPDAWGRPRPTGRDRREAERVMAYWQTKLQELGVDATIAALDLGSMNTADWSNRFLIAIDPVIEKSALLLYGPKFAQLFNLPAESRMDRPMMRQLPMRFVDIFLGGCAEAEKTKEAVRVEGEIERSDNRIEQYRVIFIPVRVRPNSLTCYAFGAFSNRIVERA